MQITLPRSLALRLAVAIAAAPSLAGVAHAQVMTLPFKFNYAGSVVIRAYPGANACTAAYTVPAGVSLRITDFMLTNYNSKTTPALYQYLCSGTSSCSNFLTAYITAPGGTTLVNNYQTGLRLSSGEKLFACSADGTEYAAWTINGFTYTNP